MIDPRLDPILDYLREHSGRYSDSALREQLVGSGYDPGEVDQAIAIYCRENPLATPAPASRWPMAIAVAVVNILVIVFGGLRFKQNDNILVYSLYGMFFVELLGGFVLGFWRKTSPVGRVLTSGCMLTVGVGLLVLTGVCLYTGSSHH